MYKHPPQGPLRPDERGVHRAGEEARVAAQGATNHCHLHLTGAASKISTENNRYHVISHKLRRVTRSAGLCSQGSRPSHAVPTRHDKHDDAHDQRGGQGQGGAGNHF